MIFNETWGFRLLTVNESVYDYEIIKKMKVLYDNFEANSSIDENFTPQEEAEENDFIELLLKTPVMKYFNGKSINLASITTKISFYYSLALEFLEEHGFTLSTQEDRFQMIKEIWFEFYPRNKNTLMTSSGFEHVFLSEIKKGKIIGLHNWIYFAEAEKRGQLNYKGWMKNVDLGQVSWRYFPSLSRWIIKFPFHRKPKLPKSPSVSMA